jgi:hypothetical protein
MVWVFLWVCVCVFVGKFSLSVAVFIVVKTFVAGFTTIICMYSCGVRNGRCDAAKCFARFVIVCMCM